MGELGVGIAGVVGGETKIGPIRDRHYRTSYFDDRTNLPPNHLASVTR
jgi:hypothetical protein